MIPRALKRTLTSWIVGFAILFVAAVIFMIAPTLRGQEATESPTSTAGPKSKAVLYESPKGDYRLETRPGSKSVWVVSVKNPAKRSLLPGAAAALDPDPYEASPDEQWLVSRDGELYQRVSEVRFVIFKKKGWFESELQSFVEKTFQPPSRHWIWSIGSWDDSSRLEIGITWPDGEGEMVFDARTKKFERTP
jgi:hypothetical protein